MDDSFFITKLTRLNEYCETAEEKKLHFYALAATVNWGRKIDREQQACQRRELIRRFQQKNKN